MRRAFGPASIIAICAVAGCDLITGPALPDGAQPMEPLPVYAEWWRLTETCSALGGDFTDIRWYVVPDAWSISDGNVRDVQGVWRPDGSIVLAGKFVREGQLVRHEMLHAISKRAGHPRADFIDRCSGVVSCEGSCLTEGTAPPDDPAAIIVDPSDLVIEVTASPVTVSAHDPDAYVRFSVSVRNPSSRPVIVLLPPSDDAGPSVSFSYRIEQRGSTTWLDERAWTREVMRFGPGQTRRHIFDFWFVRDGVGTVPGTYTLKGAYGDRWAASPAIVTVVP